MISFTLKGTHHILVAFFLSFSFFFFFLLHFSGGTLLLMHQFLQDSTSKICNLAVNTVVSKVSYRHN